VRRGAGLLLALTCAAGAARAQEVRSSEQRVAPRLAVELRRGEDGALAPPLVRAADLLGDGVFESALRNGFPVGFHFRLNLWKDGTLFDHHQGEVAWDAAVRLDPLTGEYDLLRSGGTVEHFTEIARVERALETPFTVDLLPPAGSSGDRFYYVATLDIESLSLSELEEVERWLRGDLGRAIARRGDVGNALSRGARRLLIQFSGLPRRHIETRTATFAR
jgi:hypothetical protein